MRKASAVLPEVQGVTIRVGLMGHLVVSQRYETVTNGEKIVVVGQTSLLLTKMTVIAGCATWKEYGVTVRRPLLLRGWAIHRDVQMS